MRAERIQSRMLSELATKVRPLFLLIVGTTEYFCSDTSMILPQMRQELSMLVSASVGVSSTRILFQAELRQ